MWIYTYASQIDSLLSQINNKSISPPIMNPDSWPSCEHGLWNETEELDVGLWIIRDVLKNIIYV